VGPAERRLHPLPLLVTEPVTQQPNQTRERRDFLADLREPRPYKAPRDARVVFLHLNRKNVP